MSRVGGKNASLGELFRALKPQGRRRARWLRHDGRRLPAPAARATASRTGCGRSSRRSIPRTSTSLRAAGTPREPPSSRRRCLTTCETRCSPPTSVCAQRIGREPELAVRSSATAEDLPEASFAGAAETFLNVRGRDGLLRAVQACYSSLFTDRAISYRARLGYDQLQVALSVGVMPMVRSDQASSGVIFTLDTESGFRDAVIVSGAYGLGEFVVQGVVTPDEWTVFKPTLATGHRAIIGRRLGTQGSAARLRRRQQGHAQRADARPSERARFCLTDDDVLTLARWACLIEAHYSALAGHAQPMDIEWAKDGVTGELVHRAGASGDRALARRRGPRSAEIYHLTGARRAPLVTGQAVGERIGVGPCARRARRRRARDVQAGEVLVAEITDPTGSR